MQTFRKRSKVRVRKIRPLTKLPAPEGRKRAPLGDGQPSATPAPGRAEGSESNSHFSRLATDVQVHWQILSSCARGKMWALFPEWHRPPPNPSKTQAWTSTGAPRALSSVDWPLGPAAFCRPGRPMVSLALGPQYRRPRSPQPCKSSTKLHYAHSRLPCPEAPWTSHNCTKVQRAAVRRTVWNGKGTQLLREIRIAGQALGLLCPSWTRTGHCGVGTRTPPSPCPTVSRRLEGHACLPPASMPPRRQNPHKPLNPCLRTPSSGSQETGVYGSGKAYKTLLQCVML